MSASVDEGFREFVLAHGAGLLRLAYLLTGDHSTAEDLLQSALLRAYRHWDRVGGADVPETYVRRILVNQRVSLWRRRRVDELPVAEPDRLVTGGFDESVGIVERDQLWRALHRLPPRTRAVVVLRYWQDMSETATAELLGCSVSTVSGPPPDVVPRQDSWRYVRDTTRGTLRPQDRPLAETAFGGLPSIDGSASCHATSSESGSARCRAARPPLCWPESATPAGGPAGDQHPRLGWS